jgi:hypothetical protein
VTFISKSSIPLLSRLIILALLLCRKMHQPVFIDTRYHFVREFIEDSFIKVEFVRSVENDTDIFKNNVTHDLHVKHTKKFLGDEGNFSPG